MSADPQAICAMSPEAIGPATMTSRISGMVSASRLANSALTAPRMRRGSTGFANGSRRASARGGGQVGTVVFRR